jgi:hypothetical protein
MRIIIETDTGDRSIHEISTAQRGPTAVAASPGEGAIDAGPAPSFSAANMHGPSSETSIPAGPIVHTSAAESAGPAPAAPES